MKEHESTSKVIYATPTIKLFVLKQDVLSGSVEGTQDYNMGWFNDGLEMEGYKNESV